MFSRTVLITGTNRGLGLEFVRQLSSEPQPPEVLIATCRAPDQATELQAIAAKNPNVHILKFDVEDFEAYASLAAKVSELVGDKGLNVLINNAGVVLDVPTFDDLTPNLVTKNYTINCVGPLMLSKALLPLIKKAAASSSEPEFGVKRAAIINISSDSGSMQLAHDIRRDFAFLGEHLAYNCSKAGLNMVTKCVSFDLIPSKILVVSLHPGWVRTDAGGEMAPLPVPEGVALNLATMKSFDSAHHGGFYDENGQPILW